MDVNRQLADEVQMLRARVAELERALGAGFMPPRTIPTTLTERRFLGLLMARSLVTKQAAMTMLYGDEPDIDPKILDVFISRIRKQLRLHDIEVITIWATGWQLHPDGRRKIQAMIDAERGIAAAA